MKRHVSCRFTPAGDLWSTSFGRCRAPGGRDPAPSATLQAHFLHPWAAVEATPGPLPFTRSAASSGVSRAPEGRYVDGVRSSLIRAAARFHPAGAPRPAFPRAALLVTFLTALTAPRARSAMAIPINRTGFSAAHSACLDRPSVSAMASNVRRRTPSLVANVTATYARSDAGVITASLVTSTRALYPFRRRLGR